MNMERETSLNRLSVNLLQMIFVILVAVDYEAIVNYFKAKRRRKQDALRLEAEKGVQ
jgi:ACR3 family arsenite efflux pump ArsB